MAAILVLGTSSVIGAAPVAAAVPSSAGAFVAVAPTRLLDTRTGLGAPPTPVIFGSTTRLVVAGVGGVPTAGVSAVLLNVTVMRPSSGGYVTAYADGSSLPATSNVNFAAGQTVSNLAVVQVGSDGIVDLHDQARGSLQIAADVQGYYVGGAVTQPGAFQALTPTRVLDTRGSVGHLRGAFRGNATMHITLAGRGGVPVGAAGVAVNVTATGSSGAGALSVSATPMWVALPGTSNVNFVRGRTAQNLVVTSLNSDGTIAVHVYSSGTVQVILDVQGYYLPGTPVLPGTLKPSTPVRVLDTRTHGGAVHGGATLQFNAGTYSSLDLSAALVNVTVLAPTGTGAITVFGAPDAQPVTPNLYFARGQTIPTLAVVRIDKTGDFSVHVAGTGTVQLLIDLQTSYQVPFLTSSAFVETQSPSGWTGTSLPSPASAGASYGFSLGPAACPATGSCVAFGSYITSSGMPGEVVETLSGGNWASTPLPLPADVAPNDASAVVQDIGCVQVGECASVGTYHAGAEDKQGLLEADTNGTWTAIRAVLPPDASSTPLPLAGPTACAADGTCVGLLSYENTSNTSSVVAEVLTGGSWTATPLPLPAGGFLPRFRVTLTALKCADSGDCVAVGYYITAAKQEAGLIETFRGGVWSATTPTLPSDAAASGTSILTDVSCPGPTGCLAVGSYRTSSTTSDGLIVRQSGDTWMPDSATFSLPADAATSQSASLNTLTCSSPGACIASGTYRSSTAPFYSPMVVSLSDGAWTAEREPLPSSTASAIYGTQQVTCSAATSCLASLGYSDGRNSFQALDTLSGTTWTSMDTPTPADAVPGLGARGTLVCPPGGACLILGSYTVEPGTR